DGSVFEKLRTAIKNFPSIQLHSAIPISKDAYSTVLTVSQQNFRDGLHLSLDQANLYEKETRNQADNLMSHKLIAQILIASNFKDFFCCKKDFESLVEHFMKKTVQTAAIIYG
ncbi:unnamed protein product, partial [Pocillopora meandrina]